MFKKLEKIRLNESLNNGVPTNDPYSNYINSLSKLLVEWCGYNEEEINNKEAAIASDLTEKSKRSNGGNVPDKIFDEIKHLGKKLDNLNESDENRVNLKNFVSTEGDSSKFTTGHFLVGDEVYLVGNPKPFGMVSSLGDKNVLVKRHEDSKIVPKKPTELYLGQEWHKFNKKLNESKEEKMIKVNGGELRKAIKNFCNKNLPESFDSEISDLKPYSPAITSDKNKGLEIVSKIYSKSPKDFDIVIKYFIGSRFDTSNIVTDNAEFKVILQGDVAVYSGQSVGKHGNVSKPNTNNLEKFIEDFKNKFTNDYIKSEFCSNVLNESKTEDKNIENYYSLAKTKIQDRFKNIIKVIVSLNKKSKLVDEDNIEFFYKRGKNSLEAQITFYDDYIDVFKKDYEQNETSEKYNIDEFKKALADVIDFIDFTD